MISMRISSMVTAWRAACRSILSKELSFPTIEPNNSTRKQGSLVLQPSLRHEGEAPKIGFKELIQFPCLAANKKEIPLCGKADELRIEDFFSAPVVNWKWKIDRTNPQLVHFGLMWKIYDTVVVKGINFRVPILDVGTGLPLGGSVLGGISGIDLLVSALGGGSIFASSPAKGLCEKAIHYNLDDSSAMLLVLSSYSDESLVIPPDPFSCLPDKKD
ncbi:hypothetical protein Tco_0173819 [Tanacetum coccineum]